MQAAVSKAAARPELWKSALNTRSTAKNSSGNSGSEKCVAEVADLVGSVVVVMLVCSLCW